MQICFVIQERTVNTEISPTNEKMKDVNNPTALHCVIRGTIEESVKTKGVKFSAFTQGIDFRNYANHFRYYANYNGGARSKNVCQRRASLSMDSWFWNVGFLFNGPGFVFLPEVRMQYYHHPICFQVRHVSGRSWFSRWRHDHPL